MRRSRIARAALFLGVLAAALAVANAWVARNVAIPTLIFRLEPTLLHEPIPGARKIVQMHPSVGGERAVIEIGSRGFRGPELASERRGPRFVVYGDSLVLGENVRFEHTFAHRLERALEAAAGGDVEVVNAGVTGYGPDQACLKLERELPELAPDGVIFVLCAHNDFGDIVRDKMFALDASGNVALQRYSFAPELLLELEAKTRASRQPALVRWARAALEARTRDAHARASDAATTPPYIEWYLAAAREEHCELAIEPDARVRTLFEDYYDADVAIEPESASARAKVALMRGVLRRVRASVDARGIPLCALVVPSAIGLARHFEIRVDPSRHPGYVPTRLTDTLAAILSGEGIEHLDLFPLFQRSEPDLLFVGGTDFHWNARGQELAAGVTAMELAELGWLRARAFAK